MHQACETCLFIDVHILRFSYLKPICFGAFLAIMIICCLVESFVPHLFLRSAQHFDRAAAKSISSLIALIALTAKAANLNVTVGTLVTKACKSSPLYSCKQQPLGFWLIRVFQPTTECASCSTASEFARGEQTASAMTVVTDALQAGFFRQIALNAVLCSAVESFF